MTEDIPLKPCPCCDADAKFCRIERPGDPNRGAEYVECKVCGLSTGLIGPGELDLKPFLAEMWNRRVGEPDDGWPAVAAGSAPVAWPGLRAALARWLLRGTGLTLREEGADAA